jgi:hypothetical protein
MARDCTLNREWTRIHANRGKCEHAQRLEGSRFIKVLALLDCSRLLPETTQRVRFNPAYRHGPFLTKVGERQERWLMLGRFREPPAATR